MFCSTEHGRGDRPKDIGFWRVIQPELGAFFLPSHLESLILGDDFKQILEQVVLPQKLDFWRLVSAGFGECEIAHWPSKPDIQWVI